MTNLSTGHTPCFLATTALEDFWDTTKPIVFLGEWCLRHSRKSIREKFDWEMSGDPFEENPDIRGAYRYVEELYERILPCLSFALNSVHGVNYSERYWRIVAGPWLQVYVPALYDRYTCLKKTLVVYPDLTTIVLAEESCRTPRDTLDLVQFLKEDPYNLQIYSRILRSLGNRYPEKSAVPEPNPPPERRGTPSSAIVKRWLADFASGISGLFRNGRPVIFRHSYFSRSAEVEIVLRTAGKVWPIITAPPVVPEVPVDPGKRSALKGLLPWEGEFERLLGELLPLDVPKCFLEAYPFIRESAILDYPAPPKAVFSSVSWYYDEVFKHWAGSVAERGTLLLGMQHGGNYGSLEFHPSEEHEIAITDRYFTWGWENPGLAGKLLPRPAAKLSGRKRQAADNRKKGILYLATTAPRYLFQFPHTPNRFRDYLAWQPRVMNRLPPRLISGMRVRFHREDLGWDIRARWREFCPGVAVETWDVPLWKSLEHCRIYVADHLATTFLEALSADKPTILFWDPATNELRCEAQPYYDRLREAGILHDSPEAAADALIAAYDDVERWWGDPARAEARRSFCDRFGRTSPDAVGEWVDEFRKIIRERQT